MGKAYHGASIPTLDDDGVLIRPRDRRKLWSFEEMMYERETAIPWLVEPLIVRGDKVFVFGEWGALKSWLLAHLGLCLASGRPWLGAFPAFKRPLRVLYIDEEMSRRRFKKRLCQLAMGHEIEPPAPVLFRLWSRPGLKFQSPTQTALAFASVLREFDPDVIVVESLRRVLVGDEKEAKDITRFWECVDALVDDGGRRRTVIVSHHMRKPRSRHEDPRHRQSGTTDLMAGSDCAFAIERTAGGALVTQVRNREVEEHKAFAVTLDGTVSGPVTLTLDEGKAEPPAGLAEQLQKAVCLVLRGAPDGRATKAELAARLREVGPATFSLSTLDRALGALVKAKRVTSSSWGTYALAE